MPDIKLCIAWVRYLVDTREAALPMQAERRRMLMCYRLDDIMAFVEVIAAKRWLGQAS
jgi:hypothetical protein